MSDIKMTTARWDIRQIIDCPYCNLRFDVIVENIKNGRIAGTKKIKQTVFDWNGRELEPKEIEIEIPMPPYFGVMMENVKGLRDEIVCPGCKEKMIVTEVDWDYGIA